jgi:hypothetical protein
MRRIRALLTKQKDEAAAAGPFVEAPKWRASGSACPRSCAKKKGKRSAERRIVQPISARSAAARCSSCGAPPFGAHACGTRHRFHPMAQLQNRVSRGVGWQVFCPLRAKMPRLSTLRADRSLCRSTGDPKPPGCGSDKPPRAGTASCSRQSASTGLTSLYVAQDGRRYAHRRGKVKDVRISLDESKHLDPRVLLVVRATPMILWRAGSSAQYMLPGGRADSYSFQTF